MSSFLSLFFLSLQFFFYSLFSIFLHSCYYFLPQVAFLFLSRSPFSIFPLLSETINPSSHTISHLSLSLSLCPYSVSPLFCLLFLSFLLSLLSITHSFFLSFFLSHYPSFFIATFLFHSSHHYHPLFLPFLSFHYLHVLSQSSN